MDPDRLLLDSFDEGLARLLGESVRESIYHYCEECFSLPKDSIPKRLDEFVSVLTKTFGVVGVAAFGGAIARKLYSKLGLEFVQKPGYTLLDYMREARICAGDSTYDERQREGTCQSVHWQRSKNSS